MAKLVNILSLKTIVVFCVVASLKGFNLTNPEKATTHTNNILVTGLLWENWPTKLINNFFVKDSVIPQQTRTLTWCSACIYRTSGSTVLHPLTDISIYQFPDEDLSNLLYCLEHPQVSSDRIYVEALKQSGYDGLWHHNLWPATGTCMTIQDPPRKRIFWNIFALLQFGNDVC